MTFCVSAPVLVYRQAFLPAAPLDARRFFITWREERFVVPLADEPDALGGSAASRPSRRL